VQKGVSLFVVQKILGHSSIQVTEKYAHLSQRELKDAINILQGTVIPHPQPVASPATSVAELV
jgi:integrase